ncbi:MAG: hypothetical protein LBH16_10345 [Treponema sp.]|jgi:hypothetical protein|nr:hypothetical protein [Treponema sp.]
MAIAPIDLQTLFTQMDKVGKAQIFQREGQAIHQAILGEQIQRKTEEHIRQVNEAQNTGDGVEKVNERKERRHEGNKKEKDQKDARPEGSLDEKEDVKPSFISDPSLGKRIDISY